MGWNLKEYGQKCLRMVRTSTLIFYSHPLKIKKLDPQLSKTNTQNCGFWVDMLVAVTVAFRYRLRYDVVHFFSKFVP